MAKSFAVDQLTEVSENLQTRVEWQMTEESLSLKSNRIN